MPFLLSSKQGQASFKLVSMTARMIGARFSLEDVLLIERVARLHSEGMSSFYDGRTKGACPLLYLDLESERVLWLRGEAPRPRKGIGSVHERKNVDSQTVLPVFHT